MVKFGLLVCIGAVLSLLLFPAIALGQTDELPHLFYGSATLDGLNTASGTKVSAKIDGAEVTSATYGGTRYVLTVAAPRGQAYKGKTITFVMGSATATQTAIHTPGEVTILNLTASSAQPAELSHLFQGSGTLDGVNAATGTKVSAKIDGAEVASATYDGTRYTLSVAAPQGQAYKGKTITFIIGSATAAQTAIHSPGTTTALNLVAGTAPPGPTPITIALAPIAAQLVRVWGLDAPTQSWNLYDPSIPAELSLLKVLEKGKGYLILVKAPTAITIAGVSIPLFEGGNLIGWWY